MRRKWIVGLAIAAAFIVQPAAHAEDGFIITTDHIYGHKAGMALTFDTLRPAANPNGVGLLLMVSGGWVSRYFDLHEAMTDSADSGGRFTTLVGKGYTLFMVRHGSSPYFKVPDAVDDVRRAVRFVRLNAKEFGVDPNRLGVFGASAGGHLSLMLGTTPDEGDPASDDPILREPCRVAAVVAYFPPVDLRNIIGPSDRFPALDFDKTLGDAVSPILHVTEDDAPTLLIHGDQDSLVPIGNSERMLAAMKGAGVPVEFITIPGAEHGFRGDDAHTAATALAQWFDKYLLNAAE
jgi:acetyl esterase/lipase